MIRKHFRLRRLVVALAFAAVAAPVAQAEPNLGGTANSTAAIERISENGQTSAQLSQLQIEGLRWEALAKAYQHPSVVTSERSYGMPGPSPSYAPLVVSSTTSDGFDWQDAGIGASTAFGVALLLLTAVALVRRFQSDVDRPSLA